MNITLKNIVKMKTPLLDKVTISVMLAATVVLLIVRCYVDPCAMYDLYVYYGPDRTDSLMYKTEERQCWEDDDLMDGNTMQIWKYLKGPDGHYYHDSTGRYINCLHYYVRQ